MKQIQTITRRIFIFLLLLEGMSLYGQNRINFSYKCENEIKRPYKSRILLKLPENKTYKLFSDTINELKYSTTDFFKTKGKYVISIYFDAEKYGKDSINYSFELNGTEINTTISVSFDFRERLYKNGDIYEKGDKTLNGYIRINKYYEASEKVKIELDNEQKGDEFYKGPFFKITNNSTDTLYGEYLPDYFWGTLSYLKNDSVLLTRTGIIDYNFCNIIPPPPLYPNSTKIATVGSFGLNRNLVPFDYRFEVMLAKKWQSQGIGVYEERKNFSWWAGTKDYYKLKYDFKIDKTPNP